jgi:hypothetical protein
MRRIPARSVITPGLAFLGMAALGWHLAKPIPPQPETGLLDKYPSRESRPARTARNDGMIAEQMNAILTKDSPLEKMRATLNLANSIPPSDFAKWVEGDRFSIRSGPELTVFRMIIFERWIKEAPDTLIGWADKNNYGQAGRALISLAKSDPEQLISHYRSHPGSEAELQILKEVAKHHPSLALQRLQELSEAKLSSETARKANEVLDELAKKSPSGLEAVIDTLSPELRAFAESALSGQRLAASFATEVSALSKDPNGFRIFEENISNKPELASQLIKHLSQLPDDWNRFTFREGKKWFETDLEAAGFSSAQAKSIKGKALQSLASTDPEFAFANLEAADESAKEYIIIAALRSGNGDETRTTKLISLMPSEEDRQRAREQLLRTSVAGTPGSKVKPQEWLSQLSQLDESGGFSRTALANLQNWDTARLAELKEGYNQMTFDQKQHIALMIASNASRFESDSDFFGDAIRFLVTNPPPASEARDVDPVMASSTYAVQLATSNPSAAISWINALPEGPAKLWARKNVAANWQQYDPKAVSTWLQTLPVSVREEVAKHLQSTR